MEKRKEENGFNYSQIKQSTKPILVFHFILLFQYLFFFFFPPPFFSVARLGRMLVSHVFAADQGQAGNTERRGKSQQFQANHKSNPLEKKNEKDIEWSGAGSPH